jgi:septum site-determining protein MinD
MSGTVLVVTSGKGGVGKSTTALNLGVGLGIDGHSVVLVDADLGMANLGAMVGVENDPALHDVLAGDADVESAVVSEGEAFGVVPGGRDLAEYAGADPDRLPGVLATLAGRYEYVVVDAGAGLGYADVVPIDAADEVILVTTPSEAAIGDTAKLASFSGSVGTTIRGVVVTRAGEEIDAEAIAASVGADLLGVIPEDPAVPGSTAAGAPLEQHAPDSPAAAAYRRLADVVSERSGTADDAGAATDSADVPEEASGTDGASADAADADSGDAASGDESTDDASTTGDAGGDDAAQESDAPAGEEGPPADGRAESDAGAESDAEVEPDGQEESGGQDREVDSAGETEETEEGASDDGSGGFLSRLRGLF